jgi:hypothetical protein
MACLLLPVRMGSWSASTCAHAAASQRWTQVRQQAHQVRWSMAALWRSCRWWGHAVQPTSCNVGVGVHLQHRCQQLMWYVLAMTSGDVNSMSCLHTCLIRLVGVVP